MEKIKNVIISYWFDELKINPKDELEKLQKELIGVFKTPFMYNEEDINHFISMPRIQVISTDNKYLFQMSLINANLTINVEDLDRDEIILLINNYVQLFFETIKSVYEMRMLYTSIKVEIIEETKNSANLIADKFAIDGHYEDFSIKRGFVKDDYYINYIMNSGREYNFNVKRDNKTLEQDAFDRTLISSLHDAKLNKEFILKIVEINDRYAFNNNSNYESNLDNIRGMVIELKNILNHHLYDKK